ncbi:MAG: twin-arginine translocase TatA/TatE family subunit [Kiritimatiellia bacterium]
MYAIFSLSFLDFLGGSPMEMAVVLIAVLILFGAKSLPQTMRTLGRWSEQLRQISRDIQREINDAGEPFQQARKEWEETNRPHRVERSSTRPETRASSPQSSTPADSNPAADPPGTRASRPQSEFPEQEKPSND